VRCAGGRPGGRRPGQMEVRTRRGMSITVCPAANYFGVELADPDLRAGSCRLSSCAGRKHAGESKPHTAAAAAIVARVPRG